MVPKTAFPPIYHLTSSSLPPKDCASHLSSFLTRTEKQAYLHPDSYLSTAGIRFSAHSGPTGGLALHHLRRIAAGLNGQNLVQETEEELAKFTASGGEDERPDGDDSRVDGLIALKQGKGEEKRSSKKRKRDRVENWAEETSSQAEAPHQYQELESFATTPMHVPDDSEWQDQEAYERTQEPWEGGDADPVERAGAPVVKQGGKVPRVRSVEKGGRGGGFEEETAKKRADKKAMKKERRQAKAKEKIGEKGG